MGVREPFSDGENPFSDDDYDPKISLALLDDYGNDLMSFAPIYGKRIIREVRKLRIYFGLEVRR